MSSGAANRPAVLGGAPLSFSYTGRNCRRYRHATGLQGFAGSSCSDRQLGGVFGRISGRTCSAAGRGSHLSRSAVHSRRGPGTIFRRIGNSACQSCGELCL